MSMCACQVENCVLCQARLFNGLPSDQVCELQGLLVRARHGMYDILFREGEPSNYLYVLKRGQVKLSTTLPDGREQILGLGVPGHILGFESMREHVHTYSAQALTEVEICGIQQTDLLQVLERNPGVALRIIETLNEELERAKGLIRDLGLKTASERIASFLISLLPADGPAPSEIDMPLSRREIAELLGLTVETVSRVMADLQRSRIIQAPKRHLRILDPARLQQLTGDPAPAPVVSQPLRRGA